MVLISLHPFAFRKIFLLAAAVLGLSSALCFADSLFMARQYARPQTRGGSRHLTAQPQRNPVTDFALRSLESPPANNLERLQSLLSVDSALGDTELGTDQIFASVADPLSQIPVCPPSASALTIALPAPDWTEVARF
jgi:hypothetical protein